MDNTGSTSPFESPIFEIIAGGSDNTKTFHAHASMLSQSKVLKTEVEGLWKESSEKKIQWPHWTVGGAEKFLEWLYTGDYKCPYPTKAPEAASTKKYPQKIYRSDGVGSWDYGNVPATDASYPEEPPSCDYDEMKPEEEGPAEPDIMEEPFWSNYTGKAPLASARKKSKSKRSAPVPTPSPALPRLQDLTFAGCRPLNKISQAEEFDKWTGHHLWNPTELDYETTFLTHAELYTMATTYMLSDLKNMAWQRLRAVLISIGKPAPGSTVVDNLASLCHYVYTETGGADDGVEEEEPLRMLVSGFAGLHFTGLKGRGMEELMMSKEEADREFVVDLMGKVARQMSYLESKEDKFSSAYA
ncbi:MAG: hypothetical protein Q9208_007080 [Pyrenodesmia sp. 3 TL-2023]